MPERVSVRELRNRTADVVRAVEAGTTMTLTVNGRPVADIVPHRTRVERMPAAALLRALEPAEGRGLAVPWPELGFTTDDPVTGTDG